VLFCPGYTGTKFATFYTPFVEQFLTSGWSVLLSDYRGWGESEGPRGEIVPLRQVEDVLMGLTYLSSRPDVDAGALSLFGVSFGGGVATYAAAIDERVRACAVVSPVADGRAWLHGMRREYEWREFTDRLADDARLRMTGAPGAVVSPGEDIMISTPERRATTIKGPVPAGMSPTETPLWCAERIIDFRPCDVASRISPRALLIFCVSHDDTVPARHAELLYERARGPKKLVTFEGNTHYGTYIEHFEGISGTTIDWFGRHGRTTRQHETEVRATGTAWIGSDDRIHTTDSGEGGRPWR
jgi:pimeloyl-ACP methyl ester carboxylesterase